MRRDRMEELKKMALELPQEPLDMSMWVNPHCGTPCCLAGHACIHPPFVKQGLRLGGISYRTHVPIYSGATSHYALCEFFDLRMADVEYIFGSHLPGEIKSIVYRIDQVISGKF